MKILDFKPFEDNRGSLLPIEFKEIDFEIKRIFYIKNVPKNFERGSHAHYKTEQFLICLNGIIEVYLNDGEEESKFTLKQNQGIYIPKLTWDKQKFIEENSQILVLCSTLYDTNDYIFDFVKFQKIKKDEKSFSNRRKWFNWFRVSK